MNSVAEKRAATFFFSTRQRSVAEAAKNTLEYCYCDVTEKYNRVFSLKRHFSDNQNFPIKINF